MIALILLSLLLVPLITAQVVDNMAGENNGDNHAHEHKASKTLHHLRHDKPNDPDSPPWLLNLPTFARGSKTQTLGRLVSTPNPNVKPFYNELFPVIGSGATDGEVRDALEHFFWGQSSGLAIELGASEGTLRAGSMTEGFERYFHWNRILIEGDPISHSALKRLNPRAMTVGACICENAAQLHYGKQGHVGGIIEFMTIPFLKVFYPELLNTTSPEGNWASADWTQKGKSQGYEVVDCIPMKTILSYAKVSHVNFFILDVEGGEFDVLRSFDWTSVVIDVLCIETDINYRPPGYVDKIINYLDERGYELIERQKGRNSWFKHKSFIPSVKPGLDVKKCWNGAQKNPRETNC